MVVHMYTYVPMYVQKLNRGTCSALSHTRMHTLTEIVALIKCSFDQSVAHLVFDIEA